MTYSDTMKCIREAYEENRELAESLYGSFEYYKKREKGVVRNCSEYLDTVVSISYELFKTYQHFFENSLVVYLALPHGLEDKVPNEIDFETRDAYLKENSQIVVGYGQKSAKQFVELTLKKLGEYYENC